VIRLLAACLILPCAAEPQEARTVTPEDLNTLPADPRPRPIDVAEVSAAVEQTLRADPIAGAENIDAKVGRGGIVELTGNSRILLGAERAIALTRGVPGVRDVNSEIVVRPRRSVTGAQLEAELRYALQMDPAIKASDVRIQADDAGQVILRGRLESSGQRYLVEQVAKSMIGVIAVRNEMGLQPYAARSDQEIEAEVRRLLQWHALVPNQLIQVEVQDGTVTLSGEVASPAEQQRAAGLAWVRGVRHVNTVPLRTKAEGLEYQGTEYELKSDAAIAAAVRNALEREPRIDTHDVRVQVKDRVVTFSGTVRSSSARAAVLRTARGLLGVAKVRDELEIPGEIVALQEE
jgi:osmotically-inducible protein OsmY